jgi:hypothetical protein
MIFALLENMTILAAVGFLLNSSPDKPKKPSGETKSALGGTRTPNLLIRSQMLYPLSYKRWET